MARSLLATLAVAAALLSGCGDPDPATIRSCLVQEGFEFEGTRSEQFALGAPGELETSAFVLESDQYPGGAIHLALTAFDSSGNAEAALGELGPEYTQVGAVLYVVEEQPDIVSQFEASPDLERFEGCLG